MLHALITSLHGLSWSLNGWTLLALASEAAALITLPSVLLERRGQPLSALSWTLALVGLPFLGVVAWWGIGRTHLDRKRRKRRTAHIRVVKGFAVYRREIGEEGEGEDIFPSFRLPVQDAGGVFPAVGPNKVRLLLDGAKTYDAIEEIIHGARHHLHFLFYIWERDATGAHFCDLLARKAREGVEVRVLLDALGSPKTAGRFMNPLREAGAQVEVFMPSRYLRRSLSINFRNHRKIAVADGRVAYTGGLNIGDGYLGNWRDTGLLIEGPAAGQLQEVFLDDWAFTTGESSFGAAYFSGVPQEGTADTASCAILAGGPDAEENPTRDAFFIGITQCQKRIWITTPYLAPGTDVQTALRTAVYRGVDVRLLVPRHSDNRLARLAGRSFYPSLLRSGVRIFEYLPAVLHAKTWIFDGERIAVGSANLDNRSFKLNFECTCFARSRRLTDELAGVFERDQSQSEEITQEGLARRSHGEQLLEAAANLLSPLL